MKPICFRPCRRSMIALGVFLLTPAAWVAFVALVPTDCARLKIAERLAQATGRKVTLGRVRVGVLGRVSLIDLRIGAPGTHDDPWLEVGEASINVSLWQMLFGRIEPTEVDVHRVRLRVLRRNDGSLELADLLKPETAHLHSETAPASEPAGTEIRVRGATVLVIDKPSGTRLEFTAVEGRGTHKGALSNITELRGTLNGGPVQLAAELDRSSSSPRFEGQVRLREVALGEGMNALAYLVPVFSGTRANLDGTLTLDLYLRGQGGSRGAVRQSLVGQGRIGLDPIVLDGSQLVAGIGEAVNLPSVGRAGDVWADFAIKDGRVSTDNLTVDIAQIPVVLAGWTDFDGQVNYRLRAEALAEKLPEKVQDLFNDLKPDRKLGDLAELKIQGTIDALTMTVNGIPVAPPPSSPTAPRHDDRQRLHDIGRRLRDQLLR